MNHRHAQPIIEPGQSELASAIAARMAERIRSIRAQGRQPRVVLTGGTIAQAAYRQLDGASADWTQVQFWFGDERWVPSGDPDRNDQQADIAFLARLGVPAANIHRMPAREGARSLETAAADYGSALPSDPMDLVLLGVGPDGHIASLFPGFDQLRITDRPCVAVTDSPKPPPERISLTFDSLNRTDALWFLVSGADKAPAVARALASTGSIDQTPARGVTGIEETLWLLDAAAATELPKEPID